ncbi:MAG: deoxynucleoside kinase [Flavobacteriales bacterium]
MENYNYIVIEGNIGSGKTTLSKRISETFQSKLILEEFSDNAFLPKFYKNQERYAFPLELSFLTDRFHQLKTELLDPKNNLVVSDYYFSKSLLFAEVTLPKEEYDLYKRVYDIIYTNLPKPDLYIFLKTDIQRLLRNIEKRGRSYEQRIEAEYLKNIQNIYLEYLEKQDQFPVIIIDNSDMDILNEGSDYAFILDLITSQSWENGVHNIPKLKKARTYYYNK